MSKITKKYEWLNTRLDSAKTLIARAKREIPKFKEHILKFEEQITIKSYSKSIVFSYSRVIAQISLYFKKSSLDLEPDPMKLTVISIRSRKTKA